MVPAEQYRPSVGLRSEMMNNVSLQFEDVVSNHRESEELIPLSSTFQTLGLHLRDIILLCFLNKLNDTRHLLICLFNQMT